MSSTIEVSSKMEFTSQQKLIITLLTDIHRKLDIPDSVDPDFVQRAVVGEQGWALRWAYPGMFEDAAENPANVTFVADVLEMWSFLEDSYNALGTAERDQLSASASPFGENVQFPGFDGNTESDLRVIAHMFVDDLDRWAEFKGRIKNSHMPTIDQYRRMLAVFTPIRETKFQNSDFDLFTHDDLAEVLNARRHN